MIEIEYTRKTNSKFFSMEEKMKEGKERERERERDMNRGRERGTGVFEIED